MCVWLVNAQRAKFCIQLVNYLNMFFVCFFILLTLPYVTLIMWYMKYNVQDDSRFNLIMGIQDYSQSQDCSQWRTAQNGRTAHNSRGVHTGRRLRTVYNGRTVHFFQTLVSFVYWLTMAFLLECCTAINNSVEGYRGIDSELHVVGINVKHDLACLKFQIIRT